PVRLRLRDRLDAPRQPSREQRTPAQQRRLPQDRRGTEPMSTRRTFVRTPGSAARALSLSGRALAETPDPIRPYKVGPVKLPPETIRGNADLFRMRLHLVDNGIQDHALRSPGTRSA